ncbi:MAG TPA: ABC transporter ATP-binding protein, partial [Acidimicrobiales bacterium]|nr:ABC transporter ATP-binding protein [Acidimicrobiales bacterium]
DPIGQHGQLCRVMGVMLQAGGVYPTMAPGEALRLFAAYYDDPEDPATLLDRLGLVEAARTPWRRLSGGEQQRLSLALALIGKPLVAFLDEPTAGVDPAGRLVIRQVIGELRDRGVAVLLTTHELEEAERLADRVVIVDRGRVVAAGAPDELMRSGGGTDVRFGAPPGIDTAALGTRLGAPVSEVTPGEYVIAAAAAPGLVATLTAWLAEHDLALGDLRAGRQSLEDVFLRLTGASVAETERRPQPRRGSMA